MKQLNRDWKRLADVYNLSHWYEVTALDEICAIAQKKWIKYDDEDSEEGQTAAQSNEVFQKFMSIRHVSIIVPQMMEDLEIINAKYEKGTKTEDLKSSELKKDVQQLLKIT